MAHGDGASAGVDDVWVEVEEHVVGDGHHGERLVDLPHTHVRRRHTTTLHRNGNRQRWSGCELDGFLSGIGKASDTSQWLDSQLLGLVGAHQHEGCGSVVERRGVGGGHGAILLERRSERSQLVEVDPPGLFILLYDQLFPLLRWVGDGDRHYLVHEPTRLDRLLCTPVGFLGVVVLHFSRDVQFSSTGLSTHSHVKIVVRVPKSIFDATVSERLVSVTERSDTSLLHVERDVAHGLHSSCNDAVAPAQSDVLCSKHDRLHS
mmetsp:Transcript_62073/g.147072  ORF Transcript_62073/g.147072 Transcript_62073/m.147072 type:complete len:262 (+) Transcript_62073:1078-1863(+)